MFFEILKRDIKRKKTMNIIILLFVVLAVTFISSSVTSLTAAATSLDDYFEKAGVGDFVVIERGSTGKSAEEIAESLDYVDEVKVEKVLYNADGVLVKDENGKDKTVTPSDICVISSIDNQIQKYYDTDGNEITEVPQGEIYIRKNFLENAELEIGDKLTIPISDKKVEFTVKGELMDAVFGGMMMGTPRLLMNQADYDKYLDAEDIEMYSGEISFIFTDNIPDLRQELNECQNVLFMNTIEVMKFTYFMEMLVAGMLMIVSACLIVIALVILRFTITFTLSEEFREIGIMKAIGIPNRKIRSLYLVKYLAISILGAGAGFALSLPFGNLMMKQISESILISSSGSSLLSAACAVLVIAVIMLFCYRSTKKVKKFTPIDAIRNGSTGERYKKKGVLKLSGLHVKPVPFMAVNDILSGVKRFVIMLVTFTVGILLIMVTLSSITTLQSKKLIPWLGGTVTEVFLNNKEQTSSYYTEDGRENLLKDMKEVEDIVNGNGMPCYVCGEVSYKMSITKGDLSAMSLTFTGVNTTTDMYSYIEGTPPQNQNEIAVHYRIAENIGAKIGDTVTVKGVEGEKEYMITATFETMTNMGEGIRFHQDEIFSFRNLNGFWGMQIKFTDNPSDSEIADRIEKIKELLPDYDVKSASEYVDYVVNGVGTYLNDTKLLILLVVILINILVAVLMEKSFLTKERGEIAMLKAVGFQNSSIISWQVLRIAIIMVLATVIAIALCNPVSQLSSGAVFRMMGAKSIIFDVNVWESYVIYPLIILAATVFSVFLTALSIRKVNSNEINSVE